MKIHSAEYIISAVAPEQYPEGGLPEIGLAGRSNVGKSSLINRMIQRKNLARTSSVPGKTQTLNYYLINNAMYFVDVPGYGYAKVSKSLRQQWGAMIEKYVLQREPLKLMLCIVDVRHPPSVDDQAMFQWLKHHKVPVCVAATKADKVPRGKWDKHAKNVKETLGMAPDDPFVLFSSETGQGKEQLWDIIESYL